MRGLEQGQEIERWTGLQWERGTIETVLKTGLISIIWHADRWRTAHRVELITDSGIFRPARRRSRT